MLGLYLGVLVVLLCRLSSFSSSSPKSRDWRCSCDSDGTASDSGDVVTCDGMVLPRWNDAHRVGRVLHHMPGTRLGRRCFLSSFLSTPIHASVAPFPTYLFFLLPLLTLCFTRSIDRITNISITAETKQRSIRDYVFRDDVLRFQAQG